MAKAKRHQRRSSGRAKGAQRSSDTPRRPPTTPPEAPPSAQLRPTDTFLETSVLLVARFEAELARVPAPDRERAARLSYEAARLLEHPLARLEEAVEHYGRALAYRGDHLPSIRGARRCLLRLGRIRAALEHLDRELRLTPEVAQRAALWRLQARLLADNLDDQSGARSAWEAAAAATGELAALLPLTHLLRADRDWPALSEALARAANVPDLDRAFRAALIAQRARVVDQRLGAPGEAIELFRQALALDPDAPGALGALERLLTDTGRWRELLAVLELELEQVPDSTAQTVTLSQMARISERYLADIPGALGFLERATALSPQDAGVLEALARLFRSLGDWEALRDILERRAHGLTARARRVEAWHELGVLAEERLGQPEAAARWYRAALSLDAAHGPSLQALERHCRQRGIWRELIEVILREGDCALAPERRAAAFVRAGEIGEQHLADPEFAIAQHEHALTLDPAHAGAFVALCRLYAETERHRKLIELLERAAARAQTSEAALHHLWEVARIYEGPLDEPEHAVAVYRRILELAPQRVDAIRALQRAAEGAARFRELIDAIALELELEPPTSAEIPDDAVDTERQVQLWLYAGRVLADQLDEPERALSRFHEVLTKDPGSWPALDELERLHRRLGRWEPLREVLERQLELEPAGRPAFDRLLALGELCEHKLAEPERALGYYERALAQAPSRAPAQDALLALLAKLGRWTRWVEIGQLTLERISDPTLRALRACELGATTEEQLEDPALAIELYGRALDARPDWRPACVAIERLAARADGWSAALDSLEGLRQAATHPKAQRRSLIVQGLILSDRLGDPRAAARRFEVLRQGAPEDPAPLIELTLLYRDLGQWSDLAETWRRLAGLYRSPTTRLIALRELALVELTRGVGDPSVTARKMMRLASADEGALLFLEQHALEGGDRDLLRQVDARRVALAGERPAASSEHQLRLAEALERAHHKEALNAYMAAVEAAPSSLTAAYGLVRVAEREGDAEALAVALMHEAELTLDDTEAAALLVRMAEIYNEEGELDSALEGLDMALERNPDDALAVLRLVAVVERRDEVARAVEILSRAARASRSAERARELWSQLGRWRAEVLDDRAGAIAAFEEALVATPDHGPSLSRLADLYLLDAQHERAADCLERIVAAEEGTARALAARIKLAQVYTSGLDKTARARALVEELAASDPDPVTAEHLIVLQQRLGLTKDALVTCRILIDSAREDRERAARLVELGRLCEVDDAPALAADAYLEAVVLVGIEGSASRAYQALVPAHGSWRAYRTALRAHLSSHPEAAKEIFKELVTIESAQPDAAGEALKILELAIQQSPEELELRDLLIAELRRAGRAEEALSAARALIAAAPNRPESWRALSEAFTDAGQAEAATLALAPLVVMGRATTAEAAATRGYARSLDTTELRVSARVIRQAGQEPRQTLLAEGLLEVLHELTPRLVPELIERLGLDYCERLRGQATHPIRAAVDAVAEIFGLDGLDVYVSGDPDALTVAVPNGTPGLLVPASLVDWSPAEQRFALGSTLALIARRVELVTLVDAPRLSALMVAAGRLAIPEMSPPGVDPALVDDLSRRLARVLPRRSRRGVEDAARAFVRGGVVDLEAWRQRLQVGAARTALLIAGDLGAALLGRGTLEVQGVDIARDLTLFWTSDLALELRRALAHT